MLTEAFSLVLELAVVKMKFRDVRRRNIYGKKVNTVFKTWRGTPSELRRLRRPSLKLEADEECCGRWARGQPRRQKYLVMGKNKDGSLVPTLILPWTRDKVRNPLADCNIYLCMM